MIIIDAYKPNFLVPTYHEIRVALLKKEVEYTKMLLKIINCRGASMFVLSCQMTNWKQRCLIKFLVSFLTETMFVKSIWF